MPSKELLMLRIISRTLCISNGCISITIESCTVFTTHDSYLSSASIICSKIRGTISLNEDQTTTDPLVDWVKTKLGSSVVGQLETDAANVDDTPPPEPFT